MLVNYKLKTDSVIYTAKVSFIYEEVDGIIVLSQENTLTRIPKNDLEYIKILGGI